MQVNSKTKISHLLKEYPQALDCIAEINSNFKKLHNPLLRKALAPRVTIKQASKIGGISPNEFLLRLQKAGIPVEFEQEENTEESNISKEIKTIQMNKENAIEMDVRPIIAGGKDPFKDINKKLAELEVGSVLKIINTFVPAPLISILEKKGYEIEVEQPETNLVYTYILKKGEDAQKVGLNKEALQQSDKTDFQQVRKAFGENIVEIDVRELEMPEPMVTILNELESLPDDYALFVNHKRIPQYLIPEIEQRGYTYTSLEVGENDVKLLIYKKEL